MAGSAPFLSASWYRVAGLRPRLADSAQVRLHHYRGRPWYVILDANTARVHRLSGPAIQIVAAMDGRRTIDAIWQAVATRLGDDAPTQDEVVGLLGQLHAAELLRSDVAPDTGELLQRFEAAGKRRRRGLLNPLSLRIPLWNPDRFLRRTAAASGPLFGRAGLVLWLALVGPALLLAAQHWAELSTDVGDRVLAAENLLLLAVCLPVLKALHELGHGAALRRFGEPVPEFGIMFLMMFPMPYVDASAAAGLSSPARRVAVGAAGMLVETGIAALATFVWVAVEPGIVRSAAFNVMVAASVTTVLFNANPLMRYDGYYMLADAIGIPNLASRATRFWSDTVECRLFGRRKPDGAAPTPGERAWFLLYAPASLLYRLGVSFGIALFLASHYLVVGLVLAAWTLVGAVLLPCGKSLWRVFAGPALAEQRGRAVAVTVGGLAGLAALLLLVPVPHHSLAEGVIWLPETATIRAGADGFVDRLVAVPGQELAPGTPVVAMVDPAGEARRRGLQARVTELRAQLQSEQFTKRVDALVTATELSQVETELDLADRRSRQLLVRNRGGGTLAVPGAADLAGRFLREGETIGYALPAPGERLVRAVVDQDDLELLREQLLGVALHIAGHGEQVWTARILREVPSGRDTLPNKALGTAGGGSIPVDPRDTKGLRTLHRTFQVDVSLPPEAAGEAFGTRVLVRLEHQWEPLGEQIYRRIRQLFLSRLQA